MCGDYKLTANKVIKLDTYPIPKPEDLFSSLAKDLTVINTHRRLFRYNRLCFGISSAPDIFQRSMEQLMQGLPGTLCYLDGILVCGSKNLNTILGLNKFWENYRMPDLS